MTLLTEVEIDVFEVLDELKDDVLIKEIYSRGLEKKILKSSLSSMSINELSEFLWNFLFHKDISAIEKIKDVVDFHYKQWKK